MRDSPLDLAIRRSATVSKPRAILETMENNQTGWWEALPTCYSDDYE